MLQAAEAHYTEQARLAALVGRRVLQLWGKVPPSDFNVWLSLIPQAGALVAAAQYQAATAAEPYVADSLEEQDISLAPEATLAARAFMGFAGDGRPLVTLLDVPRIRALMDVKAGVAPDEALARAGRQVQTLSVSQVQDAGRQADSVATISRPKVGWVRMVNPPCCDRCAAQAGKWFRSNQGFARHPRCDCRHIPAAEGNTEVGPSTASLIGSKPRRSLSGMSTALSARGARRLTPDSIYRRTASRDEALALLQLHGYVA